MAVLDTYQGKSGWQYVTLTRVSQGSVRDIDQGESEWLYVSLTRVSQGGYT